MDECRVSKRGIRRLSGFKVFFNMKPVEAMICAEPKPAVRIFSNGPNHIVAQACGVCRIVHEARKLFRERVEAIQPAAPGADPKITLLIFVDRDDVVVGN